MRYEEIYPAKFISRPNRFIAHLEWNGQPITAHVKNTGRCRELLVPGATVYVQHHNDPKRKTAWSLIAVEKGSRLINMDSQAPNPVLEEALQGGLVLPGLAGPLTTIRREAVFGDSRLDFYLETATQQAYVEVKGCTLERDGAVIFPDAPTLRGEKHLRELIHAREQGHLAYAVFIVQMADVDWFGPNRVTDPLFSDTLCRAADSGVTVLCYSCRVTPQEIHLGDPVPVHL